MGGPTMSLEFYLIASIINYLFEPHLRRSSPYVSSKFAVLMKVATKLRVEPPQALLILGNN